MITIDNANFVHPDSLDMSIMNTSGLALYIGKIELAHDDLGTIAVRKIIDRATNGKISFLPPNQSYNVRATLIESPLIKQFISKSAQKSKFIITFCFVGRFWPYNKAKVEILPA